MQTSLLDFFETGIVDHTTFLIASRGIASQHGGLKKKRALY